jgi:hypothetical protein
VTEYLRHRSEKDNIKVEGIKYSSAKLENHANITLFAGQSGLVGVKRTGVGDQPWLELIGCCVRRVSAVEMEQWAEQNPRSFFVLGWDDWDEDADEY